MGTRDSIHIYIDMMVFIFLSSMVHWSPPQRYRQEVVKTGFTHTLLAP